MTKDLVGKRVSELEYFIRAFSECLEDLKSDRNGQTVSYNVDFSLLVPVLFPNMQPSGTKPYLSSAKPGMERVLSRAKEESGFELVISGATLIEFYDQLCHQLIDLKTRIPGSLEQLRSMPAKKATTLVRSSDRIRQDLEIISGNGLAEVVNAPIQRLYTLLEDGSIRGIGDIVDAEALRRRTRRELFASFLDEHRRKRLSGERRTIEDSMFHYRIDAANNCLALALTEINSVNSPFVTPTPLNRQQCTIGERVAARHDKTPLILLNLRQLKTDGAIRDEEAFISDKIKEAWSLYEELTKYQPNTETSSLPKLFQLSLVRFLSEGPALLLNTSSTSLNDTVKHINVEEDLESLREHKNLDETLEEAIKDIKDGVELIEMTNNDFDIPYLEEFSMSSDPVMKRIEKEFGRKL